jgi:hypothetical protein
VSVVAASRAAARSLHGKFFDRAATRRVEQEFALETLRPYASAEALYRFGIALRGFIEDDQEKVARKVTVPTLLSASLTDDRTHHASSSSIASALARGALRLRERGDHYELCRGEPSLLTSIIEFLEDS